MGNLALSGTTSLSAINSWISVINTNLTSSRKYGYKETKLTLGLSNPDVIGKSAGTSNISISIPSSSLSLTSTSIKMYEQGAITGTGNITDFAISGSGFFLVEDANGKRYATRDGQFNFNNEGYLVTSQGLKVLSTGQDYIRNTISNAFIVNGAGVSKSIDGRTISGTGTTFVNGSANIYGDRKLMIVQLPNTEKLHYSKYGSTVFDLEDYVPVPIQNTFNEVMDGINPGLMTKVATQRYENTFIHNKTAGVVSVQLSNALVGVANSSRHALISAHKFSLFTTETEFVVPAGNVNFGYSFGQKNSTDTISDSGYSAGIDPAGNLAIYTHNPLTPTIPNLTSSVALPAIAANDRIRLTLNVKDGSATIDYTNITTGATGKVSIAVTIGQIENSYHSIGTINDNVVGAVAGSIDIHSIANVEISKSVMSGIKILGNQASYFNSNVYSFIPVPAQTVSNDILNKENSNIVQSALEESTVSLSDSLPELSIAQKMFSAISKIISINNNMTDDTNALIR